VAFLGAYIHPYLVTMMPCTLVADYITTLGGLDAAT